MSKKSLLTLVFGAYFSHKHIYRICKNLSNKFKIIVVENSLDKKFKIDLENKYKNAKVVIPNGNVGLAKSYNIGIKKCKTKYVYLNCPDMSISNGSLTDLIECAEKLENFCVLAPNYFDTSNFNNYVGNVFKIEQSPKKIKKYKLKKVDYIDNSFFMLTKKARKYLFDENYFLYNENTDFCFRLKKNNEKNYISEKIKFKHFVSKSVDEKYRLISELTRAWHYNWSKFYYYRKNYNYFFALRKISPNLIKAIKKIIINILLFNKRNLMVHFNELSGIISSIFCLKSFYRAKK
jgi:N-acetylglucosaminyl-diphospho-decaprenol L-rhamnosyltransferase